MLIAASARTAVSSAISEARRAGARQVDTRHLLLGLLACDDPATGRLWRRLGIDVAWLRTTLGLGARRRNTARAAPARHAPLPGRATRPPSAFSSDARRVLGDAIVHARRRHARALAAGDLLLAISARHGGADARGMLALLDPAAAARPGGGGTIARAGW